MNLQEPLSFKGIFNPAGETDNQLVGELKFSQQSGTDIALFGGFSLKTGKQSSPTIYHGHGTKGEKMTLLDSSPSGESVSIPGIIQTGIHARYLFMGDFFDTPESLVFDAFQFTCKDLNHWLQITGFQKPVYDRDQHTAQFNYKNPETLKFTATADFDLHIEFDYLGTSEFYIPSESISLEQRPYFKIVSKKGKLPFDQFIKCYDAVLSFLSFCYYGFPMTTECVFKRDDLDQDNRPVKDVEIYYWSGMTFEKYKPHPNRQDFLITFADIKDLFPTILKRWFLLRDKIKAGINMLTELFMYRSSPIELRFLSMAQAAEHMHRELISNKGDFEQRIGKLLSRLPTDVRKALVADPTTLAGTIRDNRNYFTHYNKKHADNANRLDELHLLGEKIKIILLTIVLQQLAIPNTKVSFIILKNGQWLYNHLLMKSDPSKP